MHSLGSGYRIGTSYWWKHWLRLRTYTSWVKFYYQRATRGWADCDTWSLDDYLNEVLIGTIRHLQMHTHGFPSEMYTEEERRIVQPDSVLWAGEEADKRAEHKWNYILTKIVVGFTANQRLMDRLYENELGPYPHCGSLKSINDPLRQAIVRERMDLQKSLIERDQKLFEEGMTLFVKYYNNLWD